MDKFNLERFVMRQDAVYNQALAEIKAGKKVSHWMWYIFPQHRALGKSRKSYVFGISGIEEARAYLEHPVLSARLIECCEALLENEGKDVEEIFGDIDTLKLRSSMTLFAYVSEDGSVFHKVINQFFGGIADWKTRALLNFK